MKKVSIICKLISDDIIVYSMNDIQLSAALAILRSSTDEYFYIISPFKK